MLAVAVLVASFWLPAARDLWVQRDVGAADAPTSAALQRQVPAIAAASVASNAEPRTSLYLSYLVSARYFGLAPPAPAEAARQLADRHIAYFLYWGTPQQRPDYLAAAQLVYQEPGRDLSVYRLPRA